MAPPAAAELGCFDRSTTEEACVHEHDAAETTGSPIRFCPTEHVLIKCSTNLETEDTRGIGLVNRVQAMQAGEPA
jgi:hypothetical protein